AGAGGGADLRAARGREDDAAAALVRGRAGAPHRRRPDQAVDGRGARRHLPRDQELRARPLPPVRHRLGVARVHAPPVMAAFAESITVDELERAPYPIYERLRDDDPVAYVPSVGLWLVTRWDEVQDIGPPPELVPAEGDS